MSHLLLLLHHLQRDLLVLQVVLEVDLQEVYYLQHLMYKGLMILLHLNHLF